MNNIFHILYILYHLIMDLSEHLPVKGLFLKYTRLPNDIINVIVEYFCICRSYSRGLRYLLDNKTEATIRWNESKDSVIINDTSVPFNDFCYMIEHNITGDQQIDTLRYSVPIYNTHCSNCEKESLCLYQKLIKWDQRIRSPRYSDIIFKVCMSFRPKRGVKLSISGRKKHTNYFLREIDEIITFEELVSRVVHGPLSNQPEVEDERLREYVLKRLHHEA